MTWTRTYEEDEPQRVNRWLAQSGVCSRREAEALIEAGLISIDGEVVADPGRKISRGQCLTLADRASNALASKITAIINKPVGFVSAQPEPGQTPAARLLTRRTLVGGGVQIPTPTTSLAPLGRLDLDSRGLLILSEDGVLAKAVIGPESLVDKEYQVRVEGRITSERLGLLRHGLQLDGRVLKPAKVSFLSDQTLKFVLVEGRNRQIRRMCDLVGLKVIDLLRVRIGPISLGDLPEGRWRGMSDDERKRLIAAAGPHVSSTKVT